MLSAIFTSDSIFLPTTGYLSGEKHLDAAGIELRFSYVPDNHCICYTMASDHKKLFFR